MRDKVLLVDDEPEVLKSFEALFRRRYDICLASGGEEALQHIRQDGPFAVVIADMKMPLMDGVAFLNHAAQIAPDSVRVMLTGTADLQTAVEAVNKGQIFRFLTKPCPMDVMRQTLSAAVEQYRLVTAERVLLEQTLQGSVDVLVEALSLTTPAAFQRTHRIQRIVRHLAAAEPQDTRWEMEMAAALSQAGCLTVPEDLLQKSLNGLLLTPAEQGILRRHPLAGSRLIAHIPRLERVSRIIAHQNERAKTLQEMQVDETTRRGALILGVALAFDALIFRGVNRQSALSRLTDDPETYDAAVVARLDGVPLPTTSGAAQRIHVNNLQNGMLLAENIRSTNGLLVAPSGFEVNDTVRSRLQNFAEQQQIPEIVRVYAAPGQVC
ncbi:MAG: response regulator [Kiritimatiellae bacterium]|nr:response regulator [Kiritimatiellia bacterium]